MRVFWVVSILCAVIFFAGACGDDVITDVGPDAQRDMQVDTRRDSPVTVFMCEPTCDGALSCCDSDNPVCVDTVNSDEHCGECGKTCDGKNGTECVRGSCVCGTLDIGCTGKMESTCCPSPDPTAEPSCANLFLENRHCGDCNVVCDEISTNRCLGGVCRCGINDACADGQTCCEELDQVDNAQCIDLQSSRRHCGSCNNTCRGFEMCVDGTCTLETPVCAEGCTAGNVCCRGMCCQRDACTEGRC